MSSSVSGWPKIVGGCPSGLLCPPVSLLSLAINSRREIPLKQAEKMTEIALKRGYKSILETQTIQTRDFQVKSMLTDSNSINTKFIQVRKNHLLADPIKTCDLEV